MKHCFLTGCDYKTEWLLPWFIENYRAHNDTPLVVADFGMTDKMKSFAEKNSDRVLSLSLHSAVGWMLKPKAMCLTPSQKTCWIDTDCQVLGDISSVFEHSRPNKLSMVEDRPWSQRKGEKWHNSGVVAFEGVPQILLSWSKYCESSGARGDQEALHSLLGNDLIKRMTHIEDLPHKYNFLRLDLLDGRNEKNKLVMHWTGQKGKRKIKELMNNE